ncbi:hypothetical protein P691DRAFT_783756 [Macrolepiota fuliginosa MF-IS2]|uniref:Plasma-membrane choline transporter-domain-containing protein n=1 Tax=Macrolepiota fuliginosa MF-IS2 TaxID=1400762 RepID=A0A9P6C2J5_9AGAR|nr:hypothetical protein P691DRAFT_783756 [Macrolepiota fuliginosa MF-IS2]
MGDDQFARFLEIFCECGGEDVLMDGDDDGKMCSCGPVVSALVARMAAAAEGNILQYCRYDTDVLKADQGTLHISWGGKFWQSPDADQLREIYGHVATGSSRGEPMQQRESAVEWFAARMAGDDDKRPKDAASGRQRRTYASQYLNRHNRDEAALSSSQPMFFSFTTDNESRAGHDTDLDDLDDPHIGESEVSRAGQHRQDEDEDPYLRLDEDEHTPAGGFDSRRNHTQRTPLIRSDDSSVASSHHGGWLAHLASSPFRRSRSRSPSRSSASSDSGPPLDVFIPAGRQFHPQHPPSPPSTSRQPVSLSLTESLLPRDGHARPIDVFNLPDPRHTPRNRRKYNDSTWTALWLTGVSLCVFFSILLLFLAHKPSKVTKHLPYTTLLHTVPILTVLTILSALVAYSHIFLLRIFVRPVMIGTSVFIPATLFISAIWAFVGSFMWDAEAEEPPTWGETVGLRLFSLIPLALSVLTARRLLNLPRDIHVASSTLTLTTHLLIANPFLLALSPAILLVTLIGSIPFLTLVFRLLLFGKPSQESSNLEWHVYGWANWSIFGTVAVWLWSWGVARGILRMSCASIIGAWYFADPDALPPPPMSTHTIHAAIVRSTGPSLGTVCLSALILTIIRLLTLFTLFLERLPTYIPPRAFFLVNGIRLAVGYLDGVTTALSKYALVYSGLTGDAFMPSARRARALTTSVEAKIKQGRKKFSSEPPLTLLTVAPLTLSFPFALLTYLFVAHTLGAPNQALGASVLAGGVTALVGLFCVGLVKDTADTLYLCYCIDKDIGERKREEVFTLFEYENRNQIPSRARQNRPRQGLSQQPEEIVPLSPRSPPRMTNQLPAEPQHSRMPPQPTPSRVPKQPVPTSSVPISPPSVKAVPPPRSMPLSQPPPPPAAVDADDLDPFQQSFAEEYAEPAPAPQPHRHEQSPPRTPSPSPSPSLQLELAPESHKLQPQQEREVRRKTSAELNMKSHIWDQRQGGYGVDSDESSGEEVGLHKRFMAGSLTKGKVREGAGAGASHRRSDSLKRGDAGTGSGLGGSGSRGASEKGQGSSQFFPGSGFF